MSVPVDLAERVATTYNRSSAPPLWKRLARHPLGRWGSIGLLILLGFSFLGPMLYPANPDQIHLSRILSPPTAADPLGTTSLGRNELARLMVGGQASLEVGVAAAASAVAVGVMYGMAAGMASSRVDAVLMRLVDLLRSIPSLFLLIFLDSVVQPSAAWLVLVIAATSWHGVSRLVRAEVLSLRRRPYVDAAAGFGATKRQIAAVHLLRNTASTIVVTATFMIADAILVVAALSFLGLGLPPPAPNWGTMLANSMTFLPNGSWWLVYPPGLLLLMTVLSVNLVGDALRATLDVRLARRVTLVR